MHQVRWLIAGVQALLLGGLLSSTGLAGDSDDDEPSPGSTLVPGRGLTIFESDAVQLRFSAFTYVRYLNQRAIEDTYTFETGRTIDLDKRDDIQLQKAVLYFKGWLADPKFRYVFYVWTSNTNQGLGAQVVAAGNLTYSFNEHVTLGAGIGGLPTTRSTRGTWPYWIRQDCRPIADEYFRGSYTTGVWATGDVTDDLHYFGMIGNNLSQLGVDAGQLDAGMNTLSGSLWWTHGGFGTREGYGDFDHHDQLATSIGTAFTSSRESRQSQPGQEDPENTQIRLSDGTGVFEIGAFGPGLAVLEADYRMSDIDGAIKYRGWALEGEYYWRWVENLFADGGADLPVDDLFDHGYQLQASYMPIPKALMLYAFTSKIFGEYGDPWDAGGGLNYYPLKTRLLRFNPEVSVVDQSPVGYLSYPLVVGADGPVFMMNIELSF